MEFNYRCAECRLCSLVLGSKTFFWKLLYNCHTAILERLSGRISVFDTISHFVQKCLNSENFVVNFDSRHACVLSLKG